MSINTSLQNFIYKSYRLMSDYEKKGNYFHNLTPEDNSPIVVHKKTNQLTYIIAGEGIAIINGISQKIKKDSVVFIEAGSRHQFVATTKEMTLFHIHIPEEGRNNDRIIVEGEDYNRYE